MTAHADQQGLTSWYNLVLSKGRAYRIAYELVSSGIETHRLDLNYEGDRKLLPIQALNPLERHRAHRRAEISILRSLPATSQARGELASSPATEMAPPPPAGDGVPETPDQAPQPPYAGASSVAPWYAELSAGIFLPHGAWSNDLDPGQAFGVALGAPRWSADYKLLDHAVEPRLPVYRQSLARNSSQTNTLTNTVLAIEIALPLTLASDWLLLPRAGVGTAFWAAKAKAADGRQQAESGLDLALTGGAGMFRSLGAAMRIGAVWTLQYGGGDFDAIGSTIAVALIGAWQ